MLCSSNTLVNRKVGLKMIQKLMNVGVINLDNIKTVLRRMLWDTKA